MEYPVFKPEWGINDEISKLSTYWIGDKFEDRSGDTWEVKDVVYSAKKTEIEYIISRGPGLDDERVGKRHLDDLEQIEESNRPQPKVDIEDVPHWAEGFPFEQHPEVFFRLCRNADIGPETEELD